VPLGLEWGHTLEDRHGDGEGRKNCVGTDNGQLEVMSCDVNLIVCVGGARHRWKHSNHQIRNESLILKVNVVGEMKIVS